MSRLIKWENDDCSSQSQFTVDNNHRLEAEVEGAYLGVEPVDLLDFNKRQGYPDHFKTFTLQCWAVSGRGRRGLYYLGLIIIIPLSPLYYSASIIPPLLFHL